MKKKIIFILFFILGWIFINQADIFDYALSRKLIENFANRNSLILENNEANYLGDTIEFNNKIIPLKAPGFFIFGGIIYKGLIKIFTEDVLIFKIITFLLVVLPWVLIGYFYNQILFLNNQKERLGLGLAFVLLFGSGLLVYSGVLEPDILALFLIFFTFYLYLKEKKLFWINFLLGLVSFFSYKGLIVSFCLFIFLNFKQKNHYKKLGFILGILPILIYQKIVLGSFFLVPHLLWKDSLDVFPRFSLMGILEKINFYFFSVQTSLLINNLFLVPSVIIILASFVYRNKIKFSEKFYFYRSVLIFVFFPYIIYLLLLDTVGDCQFPPRYLLFVIPFLALFLGEVHQLTKGRLFKIFFGFFMFFSVVTNIISAFQPTMNCHLPNNVWQGILLKGRR